MMELPVDEWKWAMYIAVADYDYETRTTRGIREHLDRLSGKELQVAKALILDGWAGTMDDLINAAKELS